MVKLTKIMVLPLLLVALIMGCSQDGEQLNAPIGPSGNLAASISSLSASSLQSATLRIRLSRVSGNEVTLHNVTVSWDEMVVTYNSFGGAFDGAVIGSFTNNTGGNQYIDITSQVASWLDGSVANNGVLFKHADITYPIDAFVSREYDSAWDVLPKLEICYMTPDGVECSTLIAIADTYITELEPDNNFGWSDELYIGYYLDTQIEKQVLLRFDIPNRPEPASIGDYVWRDANEDGIQDAEEVGFLGAEVQLYDCFGGLVGTTTTDVDGYYLFDNLVPGNYNVKFILPEGYTFSPQDMGADDAMDSDADPTTGVAVCTTLDPGEYDPTWDAGIYMPVWEGCSLTIGFWKTHGGFGPQNDVVTQYMPISLGSFNVANGIIAHDVLVMKTYGDPSNGITKLMAQMLGVRLNEANGADVGAVASELADADAFLSTHDWADWTSLSRKAKKPIIKLMSTFDDYNNGLIGPSHCE